MGLSELRPAAGSLARRSRHPRLRAALGAALAASLLLVAGCGFNVQTNQPYDPAQGVNADVGSPPVLVRNLMILSREDGKGYLSATMSSVQRDALLSVSGKPVKPDANFGTPFSVNLRNPVGIGSGQAVILTNQPLITVASPDLQVGSEAELTLVFSTAGSLTKRVPIVNGDEQPFQSISPSAASSSAGG